MKAHILVVEDNEQLAEGIIHNLEFDGYRVTLATDGEQALLEARAILPDLIILDLMLPKLDGFEVLRRLRADGARVPVIILTARDKEVDKVRGFRLDADQYVTKPFGLMELLERVRSVLRRNLGAALRQRPEPTQFGSVAVDPAARTLTRRGKPIPVTPKAFDLLLALIAREDEAVTRADLLREVWGYNAAVVSRTVDSHISELRHAIEEDPANPRHIHTVWKAGYRFSR